MRVNASLVKQLRTDKSWTQQHLADACGISLRTVQRVERYGTASNETLMALSAVFEVAQSAIQQPDIIAQVIQDGESTNTWLQRLFSKDTLVSMVVGFVAGATLTFLVI